MKMSESIANISKALASFQKEVKQPVKDGTNPHFKSKYITLDGTVKAIHDTAHKFGLSYTQSLITTDVGVGVITLIMHESGEYIQFEPFYLPMEKKTAQGAGSAATYSRRYSLSAAFGIVSDLDDDGNQATADAKLNQNNDNNTVQEDMANSKQVGLIKVLVKSIGVVKKVSEFEVLKSALGKTEDVTYDILTTLTKTDASKLIEKLQKWQEQAKVAQ
jgi:hypothetical protein